MNFFMDTIIYCANIIIIIFIICFIARSIVRIKEKKEIIRKVIPKKFVLEDIIVIKRFYRNSGVKYKMIPLIRDVNTNELLMSVGNDCYGSYYWWYDRVGSMLVDWALKRKDGSRLKLGDSGMYYLQKYVKYDIKIDGDYIYVKHNVILGGKKIFVDRFKYRYMGNIEDSPLFPPDGTLLFNVKRETSIENISQIKFFKGCIDFGKKPKDQL